MTMREVIQKLFDDGALIKELSLYGTIEKDEDLSTETTAIRATTFLYSNCLIKTLRVNGVCTAYDYILSPLELVTTLPKTNLNEAQEKHIKDLLSRQDKVFAGVFGAEFVLYYKELRPGMNTHGVVRLKNLIEERDFLDNLADAMKEG